jgi:carbon monoxide dehydrogenase subunit G
VKLTNEFTVPAPVERAWEVLLDMERVAPCLPGAAIESGEGDEYTGTMAVKIGPITARYRGTVKVEEADEAAHRTVMRAQARDQRGQGTASATITSTMETVPEGTRVVVETDMRITGPAAQFGRGVMQDVSAKMMGRFAACLAEEIAAAPPVDTGTAAAAAGSGADAPVASGTAGIELPPGPAAAAAEAAARSQAAPADDTAAPPRARPTAEVLDLGEASREALLKRTLPVLAGLAAVLAVVAAVRRRAR